MRSDAGDSGLRKPAPKLFRGNPLYLRSHSRTPAFNGFDEAVSVSRGGKK